MVSAPPPSQVIISGYYLVNNPWFRKISCAQCNSPGLDRGETSNSERLSDFSKRAQQAQCPNWGPSLGAWGPHVVSMAPTLLWGKEITRTSDADSESTRQRVGRGWSPRDPQHLAWGWAHSVKHSVKICRGNGSRLLPCPGGRPREATLLVYHRNGAAILQQAGCVLELPRACCRSSVTDSCFLDHRISLGTTSALPSRCLCIWPPSPPSWHRSMRAAAPLPCFLLSNPSWLPGRWTWVGNERPVGLPSC